MSKVIIGIIAQPSFVKDNAVFKNRYYILDNYSQAIVKNGATPIGIIMNDLKIIEDSLKLCDGFLITGGTVIQDYHLKIIDYALKFNKPLLGICMGMQALAMYSSNSKKENNVLEKTNGNHNDYITKDTKEKTSHIVNIMNKNSHLYNIFKTTKLNVNSFHNYKIKDVGSNFEIVGVSDDGVIEAIEYKDKNKFIVGVQWHPELLSKMDPLIKEFISRAGNNNENKC